MIASCIPRSNGTCPQNRDIGGSAGLAFPYTPPRRSPKGLKADSGGIASGRSINHRYSATPRKNKKSLGHQSGGFERNDFRGRQRRQRGRKPMLRGSRLSPISRPNGSHDHDVRGERTPRAGSSPAIERHQRAPLCRLIRLLIHRNHGLLGPPTTQVLQIAQTRVPKTIRKRSPARVPPMTFAIRNASVRGDPPPQTANALPRERFALHLEHSCVADG